MNLPLSIFYAKFIKKQCAQVVLKFVISTVSNNISILSGMNKVTRWQVDITVWEHFNDSSSRVAWRTRKEKLVIFCAYCTVRELKGFRLLC